ncbi:MAG: FtsX-like permease family protein [Candidatus Latescibacterota bacterium]|nr:FtsX-like permease family protein [Candidatus Latescibacterota bacterium]
MSVAFFVAGRYLRSKQREGFVSVIAYMAVGGVIMGVAALVIILSVTNGFAGEIKNRLIGMNAHINIRRFDGGPIKDWRALVERVQGYAEVVGAAPVVDSKVIIASKRDLGRVDGIPVWGIDPETFPAVSDLPEHLLYANPEGEILLGHLPELDKQGIILGEHLARRLQVGPGFDVLLVTVGNFDVEGAVLDGFAPRPWPFLVTDHFESGMYQYDDNYAFIHIEDAQRILELGDAVTDIHIHVEDIQRAPEIRALLAEGFSYPYSVRDWTQLFPEFFRWIELEKWAIFLALSLIVLVAAFNIMSILVMSVLIKTPEIGILRTMGCTVGEIYRIFVYQGLAIGGIGTFLGCLVGFGLCFAQQRFALIAIPGDVYFISSLPVDMAALDFALVAAISMVICLVTSIYPARKASRLMPVEAIRYIM